MQHLRSWFTQWGLTETSIDLAMAAIGGLALLVLAMIVNFVARRVLLKFVAILVQATKTDWDDAFVERKVFHWLAHLAPALLLHVAAPIVFPTFPSVAESVQTAAFLYIAVVVLAALNATLNALLQIYETTPLASRVPIKPLVQVLKGFLFFAGAVVMVSTLMGRSPLVLLSGLGAFTAVLLLVFRDPILGLAAGVQLISNNMVAKGDWITVPKFGADGDVIDVSLTTVSVQNWDKTISTIPTYAMLTDTFRNWRGMENSGGRRIKRSIRLDMSSVQFVDGAMLERLKQIQHIQAYLDRKVAEVQSWNQENEIDESSLVNGRRLTNVGTFRAYLEAFLRNHPKVHKDLTFLVRHLEPTAQGLPIEIYVFSTDQRWAQYEAIQADIFDHVLAVIPLFGLRVFQEPSGADLRALGALGTGSPAASEAKS